ncbi:MAG TPA: hypothetical protein VM870_06580 [Pyrinomonadaceae bacterium]|jgi:hypothetical protein|nr:hypothetical protein [Pyrinomonadaceae bacterium]
MSSESREEGQDISPGEFADGQTLRRTFTADDGAPSAGDRDGTGEEPTRKLDDPGEKARLAASDASPTRVFVGADDEDEAETVPATRYGWQFVLVVLLYALMVVNTVLQISHINLGGYAVPFVVVLPRTVRSGAHPPRTGRVGEGR